MRKIKILSIIIFFGLMGCSGNQVALIEDDFIRIGEITVLEGIHGFPGDRIGTITIEDAAKIGAAYVLDIFGDDLSGKYMELTFNYNPHISSSSWIGNIGDSPSEFKGDHEGFNSAQIVFIIDAVSGERIRMDDHTLQSQQNLITPNLLELLTPTNEEIAVVKAIAFEYAQRHFNSGIMINIELGSYSGGEEDFVSASSLNFVATDGTGRIIAIRIQRETNQLLTIYTPIEILAPDFDW